MKTIRFVFLSAIFLLFAAGISMALTWQLFLTRPLITSDTGLKFQVNLGSSFKSVANDLHARHVLRFPALFNLLVYYRGEVHQLKAGEYVFPKGSTPGSMITQMVTGKGMIFHAFTIVPGMTFQQIRDALNKDDEFLHVSRNMTDAQIMQQLGHGSMNPEGLFYPNTYYFVVYSSDMLLLKRALNAMQNKLNTAWTARAKDLPYKTAYEALIAASIIEKEAHVQTELPIMAGVIVNRLHKDILLQVDPTVIYGVRAHFNGVVSKQDLTNDNPYNSYLHKGLPPTPIAMPGLAAIQAIMHPDVNDYLFFVARGDHMTHQFSRTLAEHNVAVAAARSFHPIFLNSGLMQRYFLKSLRQIGLPN
jgi:UPF0755 protein